MLDLSSKVAVAVAASVISIEPFLLELMDIAI
jgi:hypothetical protein